MWLTVKEIGLFLRSLLGIKLNVLVYWFILSVFYGVCFIGYWFILSALRVIMRTLSEQGGGG